MDTSEQYINMCRKATELQEMWKPSLGDWYYSDFSKLICVMSAHMQFNRDKLKEYSDAIWLPRIDQLIEMFPLGWKAMLQDILNFVKPGDTPSIESECIKSIMYYNHDKSWNGEDWIE